jgi:hypothetical protein
LFSNAHQIILVPTPAMTFCTLILLEEKKTRPAVNHDTFFKKTIAYMYKPINNDFVYNLVYDNYGFLLNISTLYNILWEFLKILSF